MIAIVLLGATTVTGGTAAAVTNEAAVAPVDAPASLDQYRAVLLDQQDVRSAGSAIIDAQMSADFDALFGKSPRGSGDCLRSVHTDDADSASLDIETYGVLANCDTVLFAVTTTDTWTANKLDTFAAFVDSDADQSTGCDGDDLAIVVSYESGTGLVAGIVYTESCDKASWTVRSGGVAAGRSDGDTLGVRVGAGVFTTDATLRWSMALSSVSGDLDLAPDSGEHSDYLADALPLELQDLSAPQRLQPDTSTASVDLSWDRPVAGLPTGYVVQYRATDPAVADADAERAPIIIGGLPGSISQAPWQVALFRAGREPIDGQFCGGTLVGPRKVVTAAHCVDWLNEDGLEVAAGVARLSEVGPDDRSGVVSIDIHPDYAAYAGSPGDVAVLTLETPLETARVARLFTNPGGPPASTSVSISGWGTMSPNNGSPIADFPDELQFATIEVLAGPGEPCGSYGSSFVSATMVCAGVAGGDIDSCSGDSGGPLIITDNGRADLVGIVSWGVGCAQAAYPGVYTRVSTYAAWIQARMDEVTWESTASACTQASCTFAIDGLSAGAEYEFRVSASDSSGHGPWSSRILARAGMPQCFGVDATIVAVAGEPTVGTSGPDVIVGTEGPDVIIGGGGADRICSLGGLDDVRGGGGDDLIDLGAGNDLASGGPGADQIWGRDGDDVIAGNAGLDRLWGGRGNDTLLGGPNRDQLYGGPGADIIRGGGGKDWLYGSGGADRVYGGRGPDVIRGGSGGDRLRGGGGNDNIRGNGGRDKIWGNSGADTISGGAGIDRCRGGTGIDTLTSCEDRS